VVVRIGSIQEHSILYDTSYDAGGRRELNDLILRDHPDYGVLMEPIDLSLLHMVEVLENFLSLQEE
jgi:hypothetical protein